MISSFVLSRAKELLECLDREVGYYYTNLNSGERKSIRAMMEKTRKFVAYVEVDREPKK